MTQKTLPTTATPTLEDIQKQFENWRKNKTGREPIPDHLWIAAANLTKQYPLTQIAKTLRLNHTDLKHHIPATEKYPPVNAPTFIELGHGSSAAFSEGLVEMEDGTGRKMKIHLKGPGFDVQKLCTDFWTNH